MGQYVPQSTDASKPYRYTSTFDTKTVKSKTAVKIGSITLYGDEGIFLVKVKVKWGNVSTVSDNAITTLCHYYLSGLMGTAVEMGDGIQPVIKNTNNVSQTISFSTTPSTSGHTEYIYAWHDNSTSMTINSLLFEVNKL